MAPVRRFEDLIAWQKARGLMRRVYGATCEPAFARDYGLAGQVQRATVSVMSNIAEGFERDSPAEIQQFLKIAKGSCGETRSLLYVALDNELLDQPAFEHLRNQTAEVSRVVAGLRASVARQRIRAAQERKRR